MNLAFLFAGDRLLRLASILLSEVLVPGLRLLFELSFNFELVLDHDLFRNSTSSALILDSGSLVDLNLAFGLPLPLGMEMSIIC